MLKKELINLEKWRKQIDNDFKETPKSFHKRLVVLEKGWISRLSHKIMPRGKYFIHEDRKELRKQLLLHLRKKVGMDFKWKM